MSRLASSTAPVKHQPVAQANAMRSNGEDTLAAQVPYKAAPNVEQLAGPPANFRGFLSEAVEEAPPIVQRAQPIAFRHAAGPLAI